MRLSPDGRRLVFVAGKGAHPPAPMVTVVDVDGTEIALAPGHSPRWAMSDLAVFGPQADGEPLQFAAPGSWAVADFDIASGNSVTAARGRVAVHLTRPARILCNWRSAIAGATHPVLSDDGQWLVYLRPDRPHEGVAELVLERAGDGSAQRVLWTGAPRNVRAAGRTFVWEIGNGQIAGIADAGNPNLGPTTFALPAAWRIYEPVPLWHERRGELGVLFLADAGSQAEIDYAEWGSLAAGRPAGFYLGASTGSGYEHDIRPQGVRARAVWFSPGGLLEDRVLDLEQPRAQLAPPLPATPPIPDPDPEPPAAPLPDQPFVVDPHGVIEDIAEWLFSPDQGPDVHLSPDGTIRFFCKSNEGSGDGPGAHIGEHWDRDGLNVGHLDDASTGRRVLDGKEVIAEDIVAMFPNDHARVWASLPLNHNWFKDGARLWAPRRCVSGTRIRYVTDITWTVPPRETPHTRVWRSIPIEIRVDVGYGVIRGREVRARIAYIPDGNEEVNFYGPPKGYNAWIAGPVTWESDPWSAKP